HHCLLNFDDIASLYSRVVVYLKYETVIDFSMGNLVLFLLLLQLLYTFPKRTYNMPNTNDSLYQHSQRIIFLYTHSLLFQNHLNGMHNILTMAIYHIEDVFYFALYKTQAQQLPQYNYVP